MNKRRRIFLKTGIATAFGFLLGIRRADPRLSINRLPSLNSKPQSADWLGTARIAGFKLDSEITTADLHRHLSQLADAHVNVVELDSELSNYLTDDKFKAEVERMDSAAVVCHGLGMRAVTYYPTLEVLTPEVSKARHSMYRDHPDWVQIGLNGKPNSFVGGGRRFFWVKPGDESTWMCPTSGYVDYFLERVRMLAHTRLDGLWADVPLFSDILGLWACANPTCKSKFFKETGLKMPGEDDFDKPEFRMWVHWRHRQIWEFEQKILKTVKSVRKDFELIIETVSMDYNGATILGLDGASAKDGEIYRVWEVDAISDNDAMSHASQDDWICMAIMMKHGRGCAGVRPTWAFCYGYEAKDAEYVMALAITAGAQPFEAKIPDMLTSVGHEYRKRMFGWLAEKRSICNASSNNQIGILYSSSSRDFLDQNKGVGLYASLNQKDEDWWTDSKEDLVNNLSYVGDYRGCCKALIHAHLPYDVVTTPHASIKTLQRYKLIIGPSLIAVSDQTIENLLKYVTSGGTLLLTGSNLGLYDEKGAERISPKLLETFSLTKISQMWLSKSFGRGKLIYSQERAGLTYFNTSDKDTLKKFTEASQNSGPQIITNAPQAVIMDIRKSTDGRLLLFIANLDGLGTEPLDKFSPKDAHFFVSVLLEEKTPTKVILSSPTKGVKDIQVPFRFENSRIKFEVKVHALLLSIIKFD